MDRTQIYLTSEQKAALLNISQEKSTPMAELVRLAIDEYLAKNSQKYRLQTIHETFGRITEWTQNGETYERELRAGWGTRTAVRAQASEEGEGYCPT
jgi:hypothetical protein